MKGLGTNEEAIIEILTNRSNKQRQEIAKFFTEEYGRVGLSVYHLRKTFSHFIEF